LCRKEIFFYPDSSHNRRKKKIFFFLAKRNSRKTLGDKLLFFRREMFPRHQAEIRNMFQVQWTLILQEQFRAGWIYVGIRADAAGPPRIAGPRVAARAARRGAAADRRVGHGRTAALRTEHRAEACGWSVGYLGLPVPSPRPPVKKRG